jgi:HSP20 family molecular chaperone IbpA
MKSFADDHHRDEMQRAMKTVKASVQRYEFLQIHTNPGWRPSPDLYETEDELVISVELAGRQAEDSAINVAKDRLELRDNRCGPSGIEVTRIHHTEIDFGPYHQMITLPQLVDPKGNLQPTAMVSCLFACLKKRRPAARIHSGKVFRGCESKTNKTVQIKRYAYSTDKVRLDISPEKA